MSLLRGLRTTSKLRTLVLVTAALGLGACATLPAPAATAPADPAAVWSRVLADHVNDEGAIDFVGLRERPNDLEAYVAWVARHGPRSTPALFPTRESRLAYYINAYNALAMYLVVTTPLRPEEQVRFFVATRVPIDGGAMSLYTLENEVIRPLGEPRVHFALNCLVRSCPRLPRTPFAAPRFVVGRMLPFVAQWPRRLDPGHPMRLIWQWLRGRTRIAYLNIVSHHFMSRAELLTPLGRERVGLCVLKVPIGDELVSMCEVNALGGRDRYYESLRAAPRSP